MEVRPQAPKMTPDFFQGLQTPLKVRSRHIRTIVVGVVKSAEPNCVAVIGANVLSVDISAQLYHYIQ